MLLGLSAYNSWSALLLAPLFWLPLCAAVPWTGLVSRRQLILDYSPPPPPDPVQIGGIVGAYALSLVLVALLLLAFSKRRREHVRNRDLPEVATVCEFNPFPKPFLLQSEEDYRRQLEQSQPEQFQKLTLQTDVPRSPARNCSLPPSSPLSPTKSQRSVFAETSPTSTILAPGIDLSVDQTVVKRDKTMAQQQLEEMYRHVMELEQAKAEGREYEGPQLTAPAPSPSPAKGGTTNKGKNKPSKLNLARDDKTSRTSALFSFLKSPRKNKMSTGMNISSPIMTPMSGTFPRHDDQELNAIPPRHYAPAAPPPVPSDLPFRRAGAFSSSAAGNSHLPTPDISPVSTQSIDSRIDAALGQPPTRESRAAARREREARSDDRFPSRSRDVSPANSTTGGGGDHEPVLTSSEKSTTGVIAGLPTSPKPGVNRFPSLDSLPASPRPGQQTFSVPPPAQQHKPAGSGSEAGAGAGSAVREGGALPLRAYEPSSLSTPTAADFGTKQTVFTRAPGPLSPGLPTGMRTPWTGAPVPYTPYQPFSPVVPISPTVVTRADRKRMKKLEPRTPTVDMVKSTEEIW